MRQVGILMLKILKYIGIHFVYVHYVKQEKHEKSSWAQSAFAGQTLFILSCCSLDVLKLRDDLIKQSLTEKQQIFAALYETVMEQETPHKGLLLRGDTSDLQQGETLLKGAINEGKS